MKKALPVAVVAILLSTTICAGFVVQAPPALTGDKPDRPPLARGAVAAQDPSIRFNLSKYQYVDRAKLALLFGDEAEKKLQRNGFMVVPGKNASFQNFNLAYKKYYEKDLPVFITTDTILNVFHLLYEDVLITYENYILGPRMERMVNALYNDSLDLYNTDGFDRALAADLLIYFAVPCLFFNRSFCYPAELQGRVDSLLGKIYSANLVEDFPGQDYTQYKPRGHYTRSPYLTNYFRALMWVQNTLFDLERTSDVKNVWAMSHLMSVDSEAWSSWDAINKVLGFLMGVSDPMNYEDIMTALEKLFGSSDLELLNDTNAGLLGRELLTGAYRRSRIVTYIAWFPGSDPDSLPTVWSLLGKRYVLDAEVMQQVIFDWVPVYDNRVRYLPSGLDVLAALGSGQAYKDLGKELARYNYSKYLDAQISNVSTLPPDFWNETAYNILLDSYRAILRDNSSSRAQRAFRSEDWKNEKLNTVLGSFAELKYDTILYTAQPSGGKGCSYPQGYVEPYPELYERIADLCNRMLRVFQGTPIQAYHWEWGYNGKISTDSYSHTFGDLKVICQKLADISRTEIAGKNLSDDACAFIRSIYYPGGGGCVPMPKLSGWLPSLLWDIKKDERTFDVKVVADICTAPWPETVKEVATGEVQTLLVLIELSNGTKFVAAGPVYSYYEFEMPMDRRLTADEWRAMLSASPPPRPEWASDFLA